MDFIPMNFILAEMRNEVKELQAILSVQKGDYKRAQSRADRHEREYQGEVLDARMKGHFLNDNKKFARYCYIAYGYVRGLDYEQVEQSTRPGNEVDFQQLQTVLNYFQVYHTDQDIQDWIDGEEPMSILELQDFFQKIAIKVA